MSATSTCAICGGLVESSVPASWHPSKLSRRLEREMRLHLQTHSFAEVLRFEIRRDLDQVPDEDRPAIVRDIYRQLLGTTRGEQFSLGESDGAGVYSIEEALGLAAVYRLWHAALVCGDPQCGCRVPGTGYRGKEVGLSPDT